MVELFRIASGPWEKLFEGSFQKHLVQILSNPESIIMTAIFETEGDRVNGLIVEFFKIYYAVGSVETFSETLPRELVVLTKHDAKQTLKFLAIGSAPSFVEWEEEAVMQETDALLSKLKSSSEMIRDVSKAYDLKLIELKQAPSEVKEAFFTHPLLVPVLSTNYHAISTGQQESVSETAVAKSVPGEVMIGITREGNLVEEPLNLLLKTGVFDGTEVNRNHIMQVLIEGALLSNVPAVVFDWDARFEGIAVASKDSEKFKEFKLDIEPIGFPAKKFKPLSDIQANLSMLNPEGLLELFGAGAKSVPVKAIMQAMASEQQHNSIQTLCESIRKTELTTEITVYQQLKAIRSLNLMQVRYPRLFDGANNIEEVSKNWVRSIGQAGIIDLQGLDSRQTLMLISSITEEMLAFYKNKGVSKQVKSMIFIPEINKLSMHYKNQLFKSLAQALNELKEYGVGFAVSSTKEIDLEEEIRKCIESEFGIVLQNDVGVRIVNKKQYRVLARPTLSELKLK